MSVGSTMVRGAEIRFQEAAEELRPWVGCFWVITADRDAVLRLVPDGSTTISAQVRDGEAPVWVLRGPVLRPDERRFEMPATVVGIRLRPGVAFLLTGILMETLVDRRLDLSGLESFRDLVAAEPPPRTPSEHIASLERFLIARLGHAAVHPVVASVLAELERSRGGLRASELAAHGGVSPRQLNRLMRRWVGFGSKQLANIVRFQATLHEMEQPAQPPLASLAAENGYYDQSHLTHDAVRFSGTTPGDLLPRAMSDFSKTRCDQLL
ncbi:MAG: helix-turn-helix domain-containing protein [Acidobacteriota bacterium]